MTQANHPSNSLTAVAFSFNQFMHDSANSAKHPYFDADVFITNSGLYSLDIAEARLTERKVSGVMRPCIELRAFAQHQKEQSHEGRVILRLDVPNPSNPQPYDLYFQAFSLVAGVCSVQRDQNNNAYLVPNFGDQPVTRFGITYTELTALKNKKLLAVLKAQTYNGRIFMNANSYFTRDGYSAGEVASQAKERGLQPQEINSVHFPAFEGNAPQPVQKPNTAANTAAFAPNANAFAQPQQQPSNTFATQQQPQQNVNAFAAQQQPQPQQQPSNAFAMPQQQPANMANQQNATDQEKKSPYADMKQHNDDDKIPF